MSMATEERDKEFFVGYWKAYPEAARALLDARAGETIRIPSKALTRLLVAEFDDGTRTAAEIARMLGCCRATVQSVRAEKRKAGCDPAA